MYLPLSASQILELLVSQGSDLSLFGQSLLERISGQMKEDAFISSSMSLAKLAGATFLARGGGGKRGHAGRGVSPSPSSRKGFRK